MRTLTMFRRALASAALVIGLGAAAQGAQAASYGGLVIFGDSLSDSGTNAIKIGSDPTQVVGDNSYVATFPYASNQYSNGDVWAKSFAASIGLPGAGASYLAGGGNFAHGGARMAIDGSEFSPVYPPSLKTQVTGYLAGPAAADPGSLLYVVAGGGNDARDAIATAGLALFNDPNANIIPFVQNTAATFAQNALTIVHALEQSGATHIVVWNAPNLGLTPAASAAHAEQLGTFITSAMNVALKQALGSDSNVKIFDLFTLLTSNVQNPGLNGFTNVTDACGAVPGCDPSTYLFWDGVHPTAAGHRVIADAMRATVVPLPQSAGLLLVGMVMIARKVRRRG